MITIFTGELAVALGNVIVITNVRSYNKFAFDSFPFDSHVDYAPYLCRATYVTGETTRVFTSYEHLYSYVRILQITRFLYRFHIGCPFVMYHNENRLYL